MTVISTWRDIAELKKCRIKYLKRDKSPYKLHKCRCRVTNIPSRSPDKHHLYQSTFRNAQVSADSIHVSFSGQMWCFSLYLRCDTTLSPTSQRAHEGHHTKSLTGTQKTAVTDNLNTGYMLESVHLLPLMPHTQSKAGNWKNKNIPTQKAQKDRGILGTYARQARRKAFGKNPPEQLMQWDTGKDTQWEILSGQMYLFPIIKLFWNCIWFGNDHL